MSTKGRHSKTRLATQFLFAALAIGSLSGCQSITQSPSRAQVRIITASPDAPGLDIYQNDSELITNLAFGNISSYIPTDPGTYILSARAAGASQALTSARTTLAPSGQYTILVGNFADNLQELVLADQNKPAPTGQIAFRFVNQAAHAGAVDAYLVPAGQRIASVAPLLTGLAYGVNTGYIDIAAGTYTLVMIPSGTVPSSTSPAAYSGNQVTYTSGSAQTFILLDHPDIAAPVQVITAADYRSPDPID